MKPLKATFEGLPLTWYSNGLLHLSICGSRNTTTPVPYWSFSSPLLLAFQPLNLIPKFSPTDYIGVHITISCVYSWHAKITCYTGVKCVDVFQKLKLPDIFCSVLTYSTLHIYYATTSIFLLGRERGTSSRLIKNGFKKWPPQKSSLNYIDFPPLFLYLSLLFSHSFNIY